MTAFGLAAALLAGPALSAAPAPADAPVATADLAAPSVSEQIDAYIRSSPAATLPADSAPGVTAGAQDRRVHGVVEVGVGTHGYRSVYLQSDMPIGRTGTLSVAASESRGPAAWGGDDGYGGFGRSSRQTLGVGLDFSNARARDGDRCEGWDGARRHRIDPSVMGGAGRGCGPGVRSAADPDR